MSNQQMQQYESRETIHASKIASVQNNGDKGLTIDFADSNLKPRQVQQHEMRNKPTPQNGWYLIEHGDGELDFVSQQQFERRYNLVETERGKRVERVA